MLVDLIGSWNKAKFLPVLATVRKREKVEKLLPAVYAHRQSAFLKFIYLPIELNYLKKKCGIV